jgi:hypothetical protein
MVDEVPGMSEPTFRTISTLRIFDLAKKFYVDFRAGSASIGSIASRMARRSAQVRQIPCRRRMQADPEHILGAALPGHAHPSGERRP